MSAAAEQIDDYVPSWDTEEARRSWRRRTSLEMIISGFIGLVTSFVLSIEAWQLAVDSSARFGCDVSSVLSCSAVAQTWQARILGFPTAFLGIFFEAVVLAISVAIFAGVKFPRWYMACTNLLYTIALFFAFWLFGQSYFIIQVLCPWCLLITLTTTLVFGGITRINIRDGEIHKLKEIMKESTNLGMRTFDQSLFELYQAGEISYEDALRYADSQNEVRLRIKLSQGGDAKTLSQGLDGVEIAEVR